MISKDDVLFLQLTGKEKDFSANKIVYLGWYGSGASAMLEYAESYLNSAGVLFEEFKRSAGDYARLDFLGMSIIFMYRHYCELIIKYLYIKYVHKVRNFASEDDYNNDIKDLLNKGHRVIDLWNYTSPIISDLRSRIKSVVPIEALKSYFEQVSSFDPDSMKMRYPIDKNLSPMVDEDVKIDIFNLHEKMVALAEAIQILDGEIDNQITHNASVDKLDDCFQRIKRYSKIFEEYISLVENNVEEVDEDDLGRTLFEFLNPTPEEIEENRKKREIIENLPDDALLILDALFYVGRDINQKHITLPKNRDTSLYNVLTAILEHIDHNSHNLDTALTDRNQIDFWISKTYESQLSNIRAAYGIISHYLKCENIKE